MVKLTPVSAIDLIKKAQDANYIMQGNQLSDPNAQTVQPQSQPQQPQINPQQAQQIAQAINLFLQNINKLRQTMSPQIKALNRMLQGGYEKKLKLLEQQIATPNSKFPYDPNVISQAIQQANTVLAPFIQMELKEAPEVQKLNSLIDNVIALMGQQSGQQAQQAQQAAPQQSWLQNAGNWLNNKAKGVGQKVKNMINTYPGGYNNVMQQRASDEKPILTAYISSANKFRKY